MFNKIYQSNPEFFWLLKQMRPYLKWQAASVACLVASSLAALLDPLILKWLIDVIIPRRDVLLLAAAGALMLLIYIARTLLGGNAGRLTYHVNQQFVLDLRGRLLKHITGLSSDYHDSTPVGRSMFIIRDSLEELGNVSADFFALFLRTAILCGFSILAMMHLNPRLTLVLLPLIPIFLLTVHHFRKTLQHACETTQEEGSATNVFLQEHLSSITQIQLLARERMQVLKGFRAWAALARAGYKRRTAEYLYAVSSALIVGVGSVAVVSYGGLQVIHGALTIGGLIAFYSYIARLFEPLSISVEINSRFQRATACIRRIRALLDITSKVCEPQSPVALIPNPHSGIVRIENVSFSYSPDRQILKNIDLCIKSGERIAVVGPSGCGKSTLAKLIARLYDTAGGAVRIDGIDTRDISLKQLRNYVCYVPQRAKLFNGNMIENLRYGQPWCSDEELREAAQIAELMPVISKLPRGWTQPLGPGGEQLSGGERQRVAIARAILQRPKVLILDEATSEMDSVIEQIIWERLNRHLKDVTIIAISHRLASLSWVNRILVLSNGEIAETGTHETLYRANAVYTVLYNQKLLVEQI
jgi:ABC-type bacteriocin/lantibiotic exporter with double-glycine peptidase domain